MGASKDKEKGTERDIEETERGGIQRRGKRETRRREEAETGK